ncbi:glycosyltransferase [Motiliproteus sp. SC1-56]|uniref:glycosyltransferase n=1 Tax=Motiliproteus sp. SC1-56 TaxID=2799565 RepID=UPI001A8CE53D|nr:glycosyltransferase [Motiliproteus sp. SC1-56]
MHNSNPSKPAASPLHFIFLANRIDKGGIGRINITITEGLAERGHRVELWLLEGGAYHDLPENVTLKSLEFSSGRFTPKRFRHYFQGKRLQKALLKANPDVVVSSTQSIVQNIDDERINLYLWIHSDRITWCPKGRMKRLKRRQEGKNLVCVSSGVMDAYHSVAGAPVPKSIRSIINPVNRSMMLEQADEPREIDLDRYFVSVARLSRQKRFDWLIEAYQRSGTKTPLILVGGGDEDLLEEIKADVKERGLESQVYFTGHIKNPYKYIKNATALLMTSEREGMPVSLCESLVLETPVVAMNCKSGPKEVLEAAGMLDYLVPLGDTGAFAERITAVERMAPEISERNYRPFLVENVVHLWEKLADQPAPQG